MTPDKNGVTRQSVRGTQVPTRTSGDYSDFFPVRRQTRLPGGYMGKILRVELGTGKLADLNLPEETLLRKYWGGQRFAKYVLVSVLPGNIDPYVAHRVIVGMCG